MRLSNTLHIAYVHTETALQSSCQRSAWCRQGRQAGQRLISSQNGRICFSCFTHRKGRVHNIQQHKTHHVSYKFCTILVTCFSIFLIYSHLFSHCCADFSSINADTSRQTTFSPIGNDNSALRKSESSSAVHLHFGIVLKKSLWVKSRF